MEAKMRKIRFDEFGDLVFELLSTFSTSNSREEKWAVMKTILEQFKLSCKNCEYVFDFTEKQYYFTIRTLQEQDKTGQFQERINEYKSKGFLSANEEIQCTKCGSLYGHLINTAI